MDERHVFTVTELNNCVKELVESVPAFGDLLLKGEISNYKEYPSGHHYFTLKDSQSALRCVMFKGSAAKLRFRPENGMQVIASGRISVYPRDGAYQLYCSGLSADGVGDLYVAFEQLKDKLYREGLFDPAHKKPLPRYPQRIAIVTSSAGAAVHDMIRILRRRYPIAKVLLLPVRVQGVEAPPEIVGAIRYANRYHLADVLITGRGGGSLTGGHLRRPMRRKSPYRTWRNCCGPCRAAGNVWLRACFTACTGRRSGWRTLRKSGY